MGAIKMSQDSETQGDQEIQRRKGYCQLLCQATESILEPFIKRRDGKMWSEDGSRFQVPVG